MSTYEQDAVNNNIIVGSLNADNVSIICSILQTILQCTCICLYYKKIISCCVTHTLLKVTFEPLIFIYLHVHVHLHNFRMIQPKQLCSYTISIFFDFTVLHEFNIAMSQSYS